MEPRPGEQGRTARGPTFVILGVWLSLIAVLLSAMVRYEHTPGLQGELPDPSKLAELTMFVHPGCPCTRASLAEMKQLLHTARGQLRAEVAIVAVEGLSQDVGSIPPGVTVRKVTAEEAASVGALTSGHVVLRDTTGHVVFSGGITAARGQRGPNTGAAAVLDWTMRGAGVDHTPIFGCSLSKTQCDDQSVSCCGETPHGR